MSPLELFRKWRSRNDCTVKEAWMAGYAAGCHQGYRKGQHEGRKEGARERQVLMRALRLFLERVPWALSDVASRPITDVRDENFLLVKLLSRLRREEPPDNRQEQPHSA